MSAYIWNIYDQHWLSGKYIETTDIKKKIIENLHWEERLLITRNVEGNFELGKY